MKRCFKNGFIHTYFLNLLCQKLKQSKIWPVIEKRWNGSWLLRTRTRCSLKWETYVNGALLKFPNMAACCYSRPNDANIQKNLLLLVAHIKKLSAWNFRFNNNCFCCCTKGKRVHNLFLSIARTMKRIIRKNIGPAFLITDQKNIRKKKLMIYCSSTNKDTRPSWVQLCPLQGKVFPIFHLSTTFSGFCCHAIPANFFISSSQVFFSLSCACLL